jgi:alkanesulfonate monooxygenase
VRRQWQEVQSGSAAALDLGDGRWAGFAELGYPQEIGLVGSYEQVAQRLSAYPGVETVVLSGHPQIEEVHRTGEHLLHLVDPAGRTLTAQEATV